MFDHPHEKSNRTSDLASQKDTLLLVVVLALGSLACFTSTFLVDVKRTAEGKTQVGLQMGFEFNREFIAALRESDPKGEKATLVSQAAKGAFADLTKQGWKVSETENGRVFTATKEVAFLDDLRAQGWKLEEKKIGTGRIVTATLDNKTTGNSAQTGGDIFLVVDETNPGMPIYRYQATLVITPLTTTSGTASADPLDQLNAWLDSLSGKKPSPPKAVQDPLEAKLDKAMKDAGPPKIVMAVNFPRRITQATVNGAPGGDISPDGLGVRWTFPFDKPGTFIVRANAERLPIIFLPGVAGSVLWGKGTFESTTTEIWPLARAAGRSLLELDQSGAVPADNRVIVQDIVRRVTVLGGYYKNEDFYDGLMKFLQTQGYKEGTDLFAFPYDWRLDNSTHLQPLDAKINEILSKTKQSRVILIAHSMGGLISRAYILSDRARSAKIDSFISIGTPYWGAPKPYYALVSGYNFGNASAAQLFMKELEQNFPAAYQLVLTVPFVWDEPKNRYLNMDETFKIWYDGVMNNPSPTFTGSAFCFISGCDRVANPAIRWTPNPNLVRLAQQFYASAGTKANPKKLEGINHYVIIGHGVSTLAEFSIRDPKPGMLWGTEKYLELGDERRKVVMEPRFGDGDGTVPMAGLEIDGATAKYYVPYRDGDTTEHGSLTNNKRVQEIVQRIVSGNPPKESEYPRTTSGASFVSPDDAKTDFTLHSDAHLIIRDEKSGRALGFNDKGGIDESLPGTFLNLNGVEYVSIAGLDKVYQVQVKGANEGKFTLSVDQRKGGQRSSFQYPEIPVREGTVAQFQINPSQITASMPDLIVNTAGKTTRVPAQQTSQSPFSQLLSAFTDRGILLLGVGGGGLLCLILGGLFAAVVIQKGRQRRSAPSRGIPESSLSPKVRPNDLPEQATTPKPTRPTDLPK